MGIASLKLFVLNNDFELLFNKKKKIVIFGFLLIHYFDYSNTIFKNFI